MSIILVAGQTKQLDVGLTAIILPGNIVLGNLTIWPEVSYPQTNVIISVVATNIGEGPASITAICAVNGNVIGTKTYTLPDAGSRGISFSWQPQEAGTYTIAVNDLQASYVVHAITTDLFTPEEPRLLFDAHTFYVAYSNIYDPDWQPLNRMLASCDITMSQIKLAVPDNVYCYGTFNGIWKIGNVPMEDGNLPDIWVRGRIIDKASYETTLIGLPYPSMQTAIGVEDWYAKFLTDCCQVRGYLPEWDWNTYQYHRGGPVDIYTAEFSPITDLPNTSGILSIDQTVAFIGGGGTPWALERTPLVAGEYIYILEAGIEYYEGGGWWYYPLYVWRVGKVVI